MSMVYIAGSFAAQARLRKEAAALTSKGFTVTSSWLNEEVGPEPGKINIDDLFPGTAGLLAANDLWEIGESKTFILDTIDPNNRAGREVEFGYALAKGHDIVRIGPARNIFHSLIRNTYPTWEEFYRIDVPRSQLAEAREAMRIHSTDCSYGPCSVCAWLAANREWK
jgi:hypothetical protein